MFEFHLQNTDLKTSARAGVFKTPHGSIETPTFMPVGTLGSVKGVSPDELESIHAQIILANTYHLYLRPGHKLIKSMGGLHKWMNWPHPILTDSGGYQVFSLNENVKIKDDGVEFKSHLDGSKHFFSPEKVMEIENDLGADIIMQIDECAPHDCPKHYARKAMERTHRWAQECLKNHGNAEQALFPIVQGTIHEDLRIESAKFMAELDTPGIGIGGLSVGEERDQMYHILDVINPHLPKEKPRYLMGVGTPIDLLEGVERGIDMFDCVHATRIARHGNFYTREGRENIKNAKFLKDDLPLEPSDPDNPTANFSRSYIHHLVKEREMFGLRLLSIHNLHFLLQMMSGARKAILENRFSEYKRDFLSTFRHSV